MKKTEKIITISIVASLLSQGAVFAATKRGSSRGGAKRAAALTVRASRGNYNKDTNTYTQDKKTIATPTPSTNTTDETAITCGVAADATNKVAKRKCALAYIDALKLYCKNYPCTSKSKVEYSFNFGLPILQDISMDIKGKACSGENLEKTCVAYQGEILTGVWDIYSEKTIRSRKNCSMARARIDAAQACFQYIKAEKNQSVGGVFDKSKRSKLDDGIDNTCGRDAIIKRYEKLNIDDWTAEDEKYLIGQTVLSAFQDRKQMSSDIASLFANVGDNSWNIMGQIGKIAELRLDTKNNEYPREIVNMVNAFVTTIETNCGKEYAAEMLNNNFELTDNRSALEKEIARRGILKGTFDYVVDNTVGVFGGEKAAKNIKDKGVAGVIADKIEETKEKNCKADIYQKYYTSDIKTIKDVKNTCTTSVEATKTIKTLIAHIDTALKEIEDSKKKYKDCRFDNNKENIASVINEIISVLPAGTQISISGTDITAYRTTVEELKKVSTFKCPQEPETPTTPTSPEPEVSADGAKTLPATSTKTETVKFGYKDESGSADTFNFDAVLKELEKSANALTQKVDVDKTVTNYDDIDKIVTPLRSIHPENN